MFILDSLMISGIRWALETTITAAEAEMNDDSVLREQLLEAEMRREMGEMSDEEFASLEAELLGRIREIKERREGAGPLEFGAQPMETTPDSTFQVEASVFGDFHDPAAAPHTTVVDHEPPHGGPLVQTDSQQTVAVMDIDVDHGQPSKRPKRQTTNVRSKTAGGAAVRPTARRARGRRTSRPSRARK